MSKKLLKQFDEYKTTLMKIAKDDTKLESNFENYGE